MPELENNAIGLWRPSLIGLASIVLFFGTFGAWAILSPLESAAIAPGGVSVDTKRKTIQHLEGGIVGEIRVRDGDEVAAGDVLMVLDETQPRASLKLVRGRYLAARTLEGRLTAERDDDESILFSDELESHQDEANIKELMHAQVRIFDARRSSMQGETAILAQRIAQLEAEAEGFNEQIKAQAVQGSLIEDELASNKKLFDQGLLGKTRLRALQRELSEVKGDRGQNLAAIARIGQGIAETRLQMQELQTRRLNEVVTELRDVQTDLFDFRERILSAEDILQRTVIRAPLAGTVVGLSVHTEGGVISPGESLLDIVPKGERLVVEARLDPGDIEVVEPGLNAHVRLTALTSRNTLPIEGKVLTVSADRLVDERNGESYFLIRVALTGNLAEALDGATLYPGMQAEVMIVTGARTPIDYLTRPITQSLNRAFREN